MVDNKCLLCLPCTELAAVHDMRGMGGEEVLRPRLDRLR